MWLPQLIFFSRKRTFPQIQYALRPLRIVRPSEFVFIYIYINVCVNKPFLRPQIQISKCVWLFNFAHPRTFRPHRLSIRYVLNVKSRYADEGAKMQFIHNLRYIWCKLGIPSQIGKKSSIPINFKIHTRWIFLNYDFFE